MNEVTLDKIPGGSESATVVLWLMEEGDYVKEGDSLLKLSADGKRFNFASPFTGIIDEIYYDVGEEVALNDILATIEEDEETKENEEEPEEIL